MTGERKKISEIPDPAKSMNGGSGDLLAVPDGDLDSSSVDGPAAFRRTPSWVSLHSSKSGKSGGVKQRKQISAITAHAKQRFTEQQKRTLATFSSANYAPNHSLVYMHWLSRHPPRLGWDRWVLMTIIGLITGLLAFLLKQCMTSIAEAKWDKAREYTREDDLLRSFAWNAGFSTILVTGSSLLIAFIHPPAGGSGVPEVLAYLNGIIVHGSLSFKNLLVKFLSLTLAVSSGIPLAIQGPIIAIGAIVGNGVGQFKSKTFDWSPSYFSRFRTPEERRAFTTAGLAAGLAAAFNAPIGGFLFAMEDLSSFWSRRLAWQTFFCCCLATAVSSILNAALKGFEYQGDFGLFTVEIPDAIPSNVIMFAPAIILGIVGGLCGAIFTRTNNFIANLRKDIISAIPHPTAQKFARVLEVIILANIMAAFTVWFPLAFSCTKLPANSTFESSSCPPIDKIDIEVYNCNYGKAENATLEYNEVATLLMKFGTDIFNTLIARGHPRAFSYDTLLCIMPIWMFMIAWTAGSSVAGGTFVPLLITGSLFGRAAGVGMLELYTHLSGEQEPTDLYWKWLDPGVIAVLGAGSVLGGVTRLQLAITVIMVEMTQDIDIIIPLLLTNFVAKVVADLLSRPLYKYQLDMKALPYLDPELVVVLNGHIVNLELYTAGDVMSSGVKTIRTVESVGRLARLLLGTDHGAFPVIKSDSSSRAELAYGIISTNELYSILCKDEVYSSKPGNTVTPIVDYEELSVDYLEDLGAKTERIRAYANFSRFDEIMVNLEPYVNLSAQKVDHNHSLGRTYSLFRTLGLRHLVVTDINNKVMGIITRKDLLPFHVGDRLLIRQLQQEQMIDDSASDFSDVVPSVSVSVNPSLAGTVDSNGNRNSPPPPGYTFRYSDRDETNF